MKKPIRKKKAPAPAFVLRAPFTVILRGLEFATVARLAPASLAPLAFLGATRGGCPLYWHADGRARSDGRPHPHDIVASQHERGGEFSALATEGVRAR